MKLFVQTFVVRGRLPLPIDMLRYDACFPSTERDARTIEQESGSIVAISLSRYTTKHMQRVTPERWKSFGWDLDLSEMVERAVAS